MASGSFTYGRKSKSTGERSRCPMPRIVIPMEKETFDAINKAAAKDGVSFAKKAREILKEAVSR